MDIDRFVEDCVVANRDSEAQAAVRDVLASAALDFVFMELGWPRVIHVILEDNAASIALAEKLGSCLIRTQQGVPGVTDLRVLIYGQEAPEDQSPAV